MNPDVSELQRPLHLKFLTKLAFAFLLAYVPPASAQQITGRFGSPFGVGTAPFSVITTGKIQ
jgi:hypothetical protein